MTNCYNPKIVMSCQEVTTVKKVNNLIQKSKFPEALKLMNKVHNYPFKDYYKANILCKLGMYDSASKVLLTMRASIILFNNLIDINEDPIIQELPSRIRDSTIASLSNQLTIRELRIKSTFKSSLRKLEIDDQNARKMHNLRILVITDSVNLIALKDLIIKYGFPTIERVGRDGAFAAWLVAQHADQDIKFQSDFLDSMAKYLGQGQIDPIHYAYLLDRICVNRGSKQYFSTQLRETRVDNDSNFIIRFYPCHQNYLEPRREIFGLPSLEEYSRLLKVSLCSNCKLLKIR